VWVRYQSRTGYHNMYKEYRDVTLNGAVEQVCIGWSCTAPHWIAAATASTFAPLWQIYTFSIWVSSARTSWLFIETCWLHVYMQ